MTIISVDVFVLKIDLTLTVVCPQAVERQMGSGMNDHQFCIQDEISTIVLFQQLL